MSRQQTVSVLFTSAGRRIELLRAFRQAYHELGFVSHLIATDIDPLAPSLQEADCPYIVPRLTDPAYIPTIVDICRQEQVNLIFPLIDPDIPVLATHQAEIEATGARIAVVSAMAVETCTDKWLTTQFFQSLDLSTPQSWLPDDLLLEQVAYPVFIKPRKGSAAKSTFKVENVAQLRFFCEYVSDPIIQEFLPGPEITSDVICDLEGELLGVISRQRIEVRWGEVAKGMTVHNQQIVDACIKIAKELPAVGPITVQCMLKDGIPHFTEINARLGGGAPLAVAAGADFPRWLIARAAQLPVDVPPIGSYRTGVYMTRFDDSYFLSEAELGKMAGRRL